MRKIFNSIDIGTSEIKAATIEYYNNKYNVLASACLPSLGVKNGHIVDGGLVTSQTKKVIKQLESKLGTKIDKILAVVPSDGLNITIAASRIDIPNDKSVSGDIIFSCMQKSLKGNVTSDYEVVNVFPIEYKIDGVKVNNAKGKEGKLLEMKCIIASVPKKNIYNTISIIESLGVEVMDILIPSFGDYYSIKNNELDQKVVATVDIGEERTTISIFNKGVIIRESFIDVGTSNIDDKIRFSYKLDDKNIKKTKEEFAVASRKYADGEENIVLKDRNNIDVKINQFALSEIVEKELVNIIKNIKNEINNLTNREIGYIMITGGITNLLGFNALVEEQLMRNAGAVSLNIIGLRDNKYSAVYGAVRYFVDKLNLRDKEYTMFVDEKANEMLSTKRKVGSSNALGRIFEKFFD